MEYIIPGSYLQYSNGNECLIEELKVGDDIVSYDIRSKMKSNTTIKYIIRIKLYKILPVCAINDHIYLTSEYPYLDLSTNIFKLPCADYSINNMETEYVYNLVLNDHHIAMIAGIPCITLGHGINIEGNHHIKNKSIINTGFLGNMNKINDECKTIGVDKNGYITVSPDNIIMDPVTNTVVSLSNNVYFHRYYMGY